MKSFSIEQLPNEHTTLELAFYEIPSASNVLFSVKPSSMTDELSQIHSDFTINDNAELKHSGVFDVTLMTYKVQVRTDDQVSNLNFYVHNGKTQVGGLKTSMSDALLIDSEYNAEATIRCIDLPKLVQDYPQLSKYVSYERLQIDLGEYIGNALVNKTVLSERNDYPQLALVPSIEDRLLTITCSDNHGTPSGIVLERELGVSALNMSYELDWSIIATNDLSERVQSYKSTATGINQHEFQLYLPDIVDDAVLVQLQAKLRIHVSTLGKVIEFSTEMWLTDQQVSRLRMLSYQDLASVNAINVRVLTNNGHPIVGADVSLDDEVSVTNALGIASFVTGYGLKHINVSADNFVAYNDEHMFMGGATKTIVLEGLEVSAILRLQDIRGNAIAGTVTGSGVAISENNGAHEISGVSDYYTLQASAEGFISKTFAFNLPADDFMIVELDNISHQVLFNVQSVATVELSVNGERAVQVASNLFSLRLPAGTYSVDAQPLIGEFINPVSEDFVVIDDNITVNVVIDSADVLMPKHFLFLFNDNAPKQVNVYGETLTVSTNNWVSKLLPADLETITITSDGYAPALVTLEEQNIVQFAIESYSLTVNTDHPATVIVSRQSDNAVVRSGVAVGNSITFDDLLSGSYDVQVILASTADVGNLPVDLMSNRVVHVQAFSSKSVLTFDLSHPSIQITVTDLDGRTVAQSLLSDNETLQLPKAVYNITASKNGFQTQTQLVDATSDSTVTFIMTSQLMTSRILFIDIAGNPIVGEEVSCDGVTLMTDYDGTVSFLLPTGQYDATYGGETIGINAPGNKLVIAYQGFDYTFDFTFEPERRVCCQPCTEGFEYLFNFQFASR